MIAAYGQLESKKASRPTRGAYFFFEAGEVRSVSGLLDSKATRAISDAVVGRSLASTSSSQSCWA